MPSHLPQYGNFFEFKKDDVLHNRIKTYPRVNFYIYSGSVYYNNESRDGTNFHTPNGHINLYELNVNRNLVSASGDDQLIKPFITKGGSFTSFRTISTEVFNSDFNFGDKLEGAYPLTASISIDRYGETYTNDKKNVLYALKNTLDYYTTLSPHYAYSSSYGDKTSQKLNIVSIPSIFYGSSLQKGSVKLKYYVTGTLVAEACDTYKNGVLTQTSGSGVGNNIGVVLYNEGFIILTSSAALSDHTEQYVKESDSYYSASWHYYGTTGSYVGARSSSWSLDFNGTNYVQTLTLFAHAKENQLNFSNNPTFLAQTVQSMTSSNIYHEDSQMEIKNIVSSSYKNHSASFKPVTYISKIGIYDENKNLIAIAGLANPVRKLEDKSYTFKLKLDI